ncbi:hypothetical protein [Streptomyces sp. NPDC052042]|uniref:hypothetical protein n=1 Tax=Streptomyces sp. NPDC052042 TaxID=3365683 RepID=UPI0037D4B04F
MTDDLTADATATRSPRVWIASLISTIVTLPLACIALFLAGISPMACDSCQGAAARRFDASFGPAWTVFNCGLVLALITLVGSWALWRGRPPAGLFLAVLAPGVVFFAALLFMAMIDWP